MGSDIMVGTHKEVAPSNPNPLMGGQTAPLDKAQSPKTTTAHLLELKKLKDDGLVTPEVYDQRQSAILKESN